MTTPINDGGPAFPQYKPGAVYDRTESVGGMSLRDHFAAEAMNGQIAFEGMEGCDPEHIAAMSFELADAMIKEREKGKQ